MAGRLRNRCSIPRRNKRFFSTSKRPDHHWTTQSIVQWILGGSFPGNKAAGTWSCLLTSQRLSYERMELHLHSAITHYGVQSEKCAFTVFEGMIGRSHPYVLKPFIQCHGRRTRYVRQRTATEWTTSFDFRKRQLYHQSHQVNSMGPPATPETDTAQFLQFTTAGAWIYHWFESSDECSKPILHSFTLT